MKKPDRQRPICIVASAGGHLSEALKATALLKAYPRFYVTFYLPHIKDSLRGEECHYVIFPRLNPGKYVLNLFQSLRIYLKKKPQVIITTGGGMAVPFCVVGKLFGAKLVFIESGARVVRPSRASRVLYPLSDLCLVQWEPLLAYFPKAVLGGYLT
jgi:UDP-N-acetylglucosamine:LPS N-acetylglucosamine transferase